ncbi:MAG: hypothetical protein PHX44_04180 [Sulfurimonas sp.]|uniref:hypothetical protein n=1 Tax=Sulfurimonas sp. TaxID=2022749 RepID=UPI002624CE56|nr:hypothetical protein [Sulfurimonas sp.]MDD2652230.1 hypothetical protein [Sulfurimonas sp.]MDD3450488.1 hypothetical protein [Sulfurimonas sp.]
MSDTTKKILFFIVILMIALYFKFEDSAAKQKEQLLQEAINKPLSEIEKELNLVFVDMMKDKNITK